MKQLSWKHSQRSNKLVKTVSYVKFIRAYFFEQTLALIYNAVDAAEVWVQMENRKLPDKPDGLKTAKLISEDYFNRNQTKWPK